jgi:hypothetical protein
MGVASEEPRSVGIGMGVMIRRNNMKPMMLVGQGGKTFIRVAASLLLLGGVGCSSLADLSGYGDKELGEHGPHLYGGVSLDSAVMKRPIGVRPNERPPGPYEPLRYIFALFDIPFAFVADTALLPITGLSELIVAHDRAKAAPPVKTVASSGDSVSGSRSSRPEP